MTTGINPDTVTPADGAWRRLTSATCAEVLVQREPDATWLHDQRWATTARLAGVWSDGQISAYVQYGDREFARGQEVGESLSCDKLRKLIGAAALGLVLVVLPAPAQQFPWPTRQVTATATGTLPGEFTRIAGAVLWPDGRVLVAERTEGQLTLYSSTGAVLWQVGRQGEGPGEYRGLNAVARCGQTIVVSDAVTLRLTRLNADSGRVVTTQPGLPPGTEAVSCRDSETMAVRIPGRPYGPPDPEAGFRVPVELRLLGSDAPALAVGFNRYFMGSSAFIDPPFTDLALAAGGGRVVYLCQTEEGSCTSIDLAGQARHTFTLALPRPELTDRQWEEAIAQRIAAFGRLPARAQAQVTKTFAEAPKPKRFPALGGLAADASGRLWVRTYATDGALATWLVVSSVGRPLATVRLPSEADPLGIGTGQLIARVVDPDGIQRVQRFAFAPLP